jgi:AcrR family transcriptional regulator
VSSDPRRRPRRRGEALDQAILHATFAELTEVGYAGLTMERVAERSGTGKASLYRRWPSRMELALDAVHLVLPDPASPPDTGSLRGDVLAFLRSVADLLAGPAGQALRGLLSDALADPHRIAELRRHSQSPSRKAMREIVRRAVDRGEVNPDVLTDRRIEVAPALLRHHFLFHGVPVPDDVIVGIVDEVVVPLLTAR